MIRHLGHGSNASCGTGLAFNGLTGRCDYLNNIEKCLLGSRTEHVESLDNDNDCRCKDQEDGLYANGCTEKFYSCSNGISTGFECPPELVFNVQGEWFMRMYLRGHDDTDMPPSGCAVLDDGIYGLAPCGVGYYHCLRGATSFSKCAFGLVFNPSLGRCDFR
ncbi:unnamed protein product [Gongylonema pulchrum]|uniref:Chitin-binding type-2 domain-containing protein n=1 Tax=Gongylonema pulchrum TaxID=637853 RepID=A0A183CWL5_9BILA|nr:unnamed protein product [Gongylonema pulchrum]